MIQSFFQQHLRQPSDGPNLIVLDTAAFAKPLLARIKMLPGITWEDEDVIQKVMQCIAYESKAQDELAWGCVDLVHQALGTAFENHATDLVNALMEFGTNLYEQLRAAKAYQKGYLFYQFQGWICNDVVLVKFVVDVDPND